MTPFLPLEFYKAKLHIESKIRDFKDAAKNSSTQISPKEKNGLVIALDAIGEQCEKCHLIHSLERVCQIKFRAEWGEDCTPHILAVSLEEMLETMTGELRKRQFAFIAPEKTNFFERDDFFDNTTKQVFPDAVIEMKDAGNCLAADLTTAAVFHLMRVAELGLRKLASDASWGIILTGPIEFATWGHVLDAIDSKMKAQKGIPKSTAREEDLQSYTGLVREIRAFQFAWRDPAMHTRTRFEPEQGEKVFDHVLCFMRTLAKRLSKG
jgi:hypothetical protein